MEEKTPTNKGANSMNQEIDHILTDEEGNETHAIRFVQREDAVYLRLAETTVNESWDRTSNIQVMNTTQSEGIELMVSQHIAEDGTDFAINSRIVISKDDAKRLISTLAHLL